MIFYATMKIIHEKHTTYHYFHYLCTRYHSRSRRIEAFGGVCKAFLLLRWENKGKWDKWCHDII